MEWSKVTLLGPLANLSDAFSKGFSIAAGSCPLVTEFRGGH